MILRDDNENSCLLRLPNQEDSFNVNLVSSICKKEINIASAVQYIAFRRLGNEIQI